MGTGSTAPPSSPAGGGPGEGYRVGLVGPGRAGRAVASALAAAGHATVGTVGRDRPPAALADLAGRADLLLLTVPDDALAGVAADLAPAVRPGTVVVHTSGRYGRDVLAPLAAAGARTLALHPVMTLTGGPDDVARLGAVAWGTTTAEGDLGLAGRLVADLGGTLVAVAEGARPLYHAALAAGANHLVTLVAEAADLLRAAGVSDTGAVLGPLLSVALAGALRDGDAALTGPVVRGDAGTVAAHREAVAAARPAGLAAYQAMARLTAARAVAAGRLDPVAAAAVLAVLAGEDRGEGAPPRGAPPRQHRLVRRPRVTVRRPPRRPPARTACGRGHAPERAATVPRGAGALTSTTSSGTPARTGTGIAMSIDVVTRPLPPRSRTEPLLVHDRRSLAAARAALPGRVALVPTMGALHSGHAALVDAARALADSVVVIGLRQPAAVR